LGTRRADRRVRVGGAHLVLQTGGMPHLMPVVNKKFLAPGFGRTKTEIWRNWG
jgi:hypothetical protein